MNVPIDKNLDAVIRHIVKTDIGDLLAQELKIRFKTIQDQMTIMQQSNDNISQQIKEDRQDINQLKIDMSKSLEQNKVIIENQNTQETKVVEAVEQATDAIPHKVSESVDKIFQKQSFMRKWVDTLIK